MLVHWVSLRQSAKRQSLTWKEPVNLKTTQNTVGTMETASFSLIKFMILCADFSIILPIMKGTGVITHGNTIFFANISA